MAGGTKLEDDSEHHQQPSPTHRFPTPSDPHHHHHHHHPPNTNKSKSHDKNKDSPASASAKRRCVSTACIACRRRKSKVRVPPVCNATLRDQDHWLTNDFNDQCDGNTPSCAACSSVYGTECVYDPNSDHRRKGVYKKDIDNLKTRNSTLQTLIQAILNYPENEVPDLVKQIRTCESLDDVAESILARDNGVGEDDGIDEAPTSDGTPSTVPKFEKELSGKLGKLRLDNGSMSIIGGTSNLIFVGSGTDGEDGGSTTEDSELYEEQELAITSWTDVTSDPDLVVHLLNMYFAWHYTYFTTLSKSLFYRDFQRGKTAHDVKRKTEYCTPLLVNAMLALGCHFTSWPQARANPKDSATAGDHFFREAKRLILENDEHENPRLTTVQAFALMSVREAGCGREARGWVYSGMSFRMACDLGLNIDSGSDNLDEAEIDARRVTIWGCFLFDKCWSNYLGRQPQLPLSSIAAPKFDVFPMEDADMWSPYLDTGVGKTHVQACRTRAVAIQTSQLCEISGDLLLYFYHPHQLEKPMGKQAELKKLSELHTRLEAWRKNVPKEMEPKEGQLPNVLVLHMFFQLLFIHLFRPFLKYKQATSPLPSHVSPRKILTHAASMISKLLRLYKRTYGLRQICNIVVYISHSACTVHLLNLPDKNAARDLVHGLKHLEEIGESWLCARRTLGILHMVAVRWKIELPEEADKTIQRAQEKFGSLSTPDREVTPKADNQMLPPTPMQPLPPPIAKPKTESNAKNHLNPTNGVASNGFFPTTAPLASPMPTSDMPRLDSLLTVPLQSANEFNQKSRKHSYVMPQPQQEMWNNSQAPQAPQVQQTSPTTLFGGVDSLMQDQEWWLRDSNQMFANWNGMEQEAALQGNAGFDKGTGNLGYGPGVYGMNGNMNGTGLNGYGGQLNDKL